VRYASREADDVGHVINGHAVLQTNDDGSLVEKRFHEFAHPAGVVGLHRDENDVEGLTQLGNLAEMEHVYRSRLGGAVRQVHGESVLAHCFDGGWPLFDERHIESRAHLIAAERGTVRARSDDGDLQGCDGVTSSCWVSRCCAWS